MGLYLAVFDDEEEVDGVEVGSYDDFGTLRDYIIERFENGEPGSKFPTLINHSDCDGEWSPAECVKLSVELSKLIELFKRQPAVEFVSEWQKLVAK